MSMFKLSDIKPGYLLRLYDSDKNVDFFVTVLPCSAYKFQTIIGAILASAIGIPKDGDLALCGDDFYSTLGCFDDNLTDRILGDLRIDAVYGYTTPSNLLDNDPELRELLWERDAEAKEEPEAEPVKHMTLEEVCEALGYAVEITPPRND